MKLRSTISVTWLAPPSHDDLNALWEIDQIDAQAERTPADDARRAALASQIAPASQIRATLSTLSALQYGRYEANRRTFVEWVESETGQPIAGATASEDGRRLIDLGAKWARTLAALKSLEERSVSRLDDEHDGEWMQIEAPAAWATPAGYLDDAPQELVEQLHAAAWDCNSTLFMPNQSEDAKKKGGASVS